MGQRLKTLLALVGLSVITIVVFEGLSRYAFVPLLTGDTSGLQTDLIVFEDADYEVSQLITEIESSYSREYRPYTVWKRKPFSGTLVNVDQDGNRRTTNNSLEDHALKVWMFGGSTMWGWGAPDSETVPSHFSRIMNEGFGVDSNVVNFGEDAFVSTQELVSLMRELQQGNRPDVVIFYDGINDAAAAALWPGVKGTHHNLYSIQDKFQRSRASMRAAIRSTDTFRLLDLLAGRLMRDSIQIGPVAAASAGDNQDMALDALNLWLENYRMVDSLSETYGFTAIFLFQPALGIGDKPMGPLEQQLIEGWKGTSNWLGTEVHAEMREIIRESYPGKQILPGVFDISDVFEQTADPVYLDWAHLSGTGNLIVAEEIFTIVRNELCAGHPVQASGRAVAQLASACSSQAKSLGD